MRAPQDLVILLLQADPKTGNGLRHYQEGVTGRSQDMRWGVEGDPRILNEVFGSDIF